MHEVFYEGPREHDAQVEAVLGARSRNVVKVLLALVELFDFFRLRQPSIGSHSGAVAVGDHCARCDLVRCAAAGGLEAARVHRVRPRDAHVLVRLLVVDEQVAGELVVGGRRAGGLDLRRHHDVELADLGRAGEHLDRVLVVRDLVGLRRHHPAPAEGLRLEARDARLEGRLARGTRLLVCQLFLGSKRHVKSELRNNSPSVRKDSARADSASHTCGGITNMLGATP